MNATGVGSGNTHKRGVEGWELAVKETHRQSQHFPASIRCPCAVCYAGHKQHSTAQGYGWASVLNSARVGEDRGGSSLCAHTYVHTYVCARL